VSRGVVSNQLEADGGAWWPQCRPFGAPGDGRGRSGAALRPLRPGAGPDRL